jgi:formate hydrogenlyase transcriptional activator
MGIRSSLIIPLFTGKEVRHIVIQQTMEGGGILSKEYIPRLRLLGEILINALDRKEADDALRESEARLSLAAASAKAVLWTVEAEKGFVWLTGPDREMLGFTSKEEITLERSLDIVHAEDRSQLREILSRTHTAGQEANGEFRIVLPDGSVRWTAFRGRAQYSSSGGPLRLMGCSIDTSERKRADEQLRQALETSTE